LPTHKTNCGVLLFVEHLQGRKEYRLATDYTDEHRFFFSQRISKDFLPQRHGDTEEYSTEVFSRKGAKNTGLSTGRHITRIKIYIFMAQESFLKNVT